MAEEIKFNVSCKNLDGSSQTSKVTLDENNEFSFENGSEPGPLSEYVKKTDLVVLTQQEYDDLVSQGLVDENKFYFIKE